MAGEKTTAQPSKTELLRSLAFLVRGLSALFWGLPLMLVVYVQTAETDWLHMLGWMAIIPSLLVTALVFYGLSQMRYFQPQERVWMRALERAQLLVFVNLGLVPFLYWWQKLPKERLYGVAVTLLAYSSILVLFNVNHLLHRLAAMLPDETLRAETHLFASLNRILLGSVFVLISAHLLFSGVKTLPGPLIAVLAVVQPFGLWLLLFLILMPLAMTMALIWKIKEVIYNSIFEAAG